MAAADPIAPTTTRALRVLALAYFVQATGALSVVGALAAISAEWGLSDALSASLVSVFGVTFALAAPTLQVLLGHLERRRQVLLGLTLFSAAALLLAAAPGYEVMLVARVLMGLGAAFIGPVLGALGSGLVPAAQQGSAIAMVLLGLSVAGLVGMPLSAWLAHVAGARGLFLAVAVAGALTALLVRAWVPQGVAGQRVRAADLLAMLVQPRWISGFLVAFFMSASVYTTYTFLVPILRDVFHAEPSLVSVALAVLGVAGILGNLVVTRAARRYSSERMLIAGMLLLALDLPLLWLAAPHLAPLWVGLALWAFATDLLWPSQQRRIVEMDPGLRGLSLSLTASFVFLGIGAGAAAGGVIYPHWGYAGLLLTTLGGLVLAALSLAVSSVGAPRPGAQPA